MKSFVFSFLLVFTCAFSSISQEKVLSFNVLQESKMIKKNTYSLSNNLNNDLAIFIREKKKGFAYLFDEAFKPKSKFEFDYSKKEKYDVLLGEKIKESEYSLLYSNDKTNKFCVFTIDFESKKSSLKEFEIDFKDERYLKTVSHKNKLYVLTDNRLNNKIIIRELNDNYEFEIVKSYLIELDKKQKLHKNNFTNNVFWRTFEPNIIKIDNRIPNTIEHVSEDNKIYKQGDNLYLTFDNKTNSTLMYVISLMDYSIERKEFIYPKGKKDDFDKYNSYFVDNKLFQIASSSNEMILIAKNLDDEILKFYYFDKETPINIKNSTIIQDGATALPFVTKREFEETSKFLRKISSGNIGISGYKKDDAYHFTIGGVKEVRNNMPVPMMIPNTTPITLNNQVHYITTYNPVYSSYSSYSTTKSTYFKTKFDLNFNYIEDTVVENIFEKIEKYNNSLKHISGEDVFYHNEQLIFSYFSLVDSEFNLVKF